MALAHLETSSFLVDNGRGHRLFVKRIIEPSAYDPSRRALLIVPGYGMNSFIFGYHPRGTSLMGHLARLGFEVWTFDLRGTGSSQRLHRHAEKACLQSYIVDDLPKIIEAVLMRTASVDDTRLDVIGASLGGTMVYAHLALRGRHDSRFGRVVTVGAPLRWERIHPALRVAFASPWLIGRIRLAGTRRLAEVALPVVRRVPKLLSFYMNPAIVDLRRASELARTVEDPNPTVNADIARWMKERDLSLLGVNVTEALVDLGDMPLLVVVANRDGIVPLETALSAERAWGGPVETLHVGDDKTWYAHADLFIGDPAPEAVFDPIAAFLMRDAHAAA